MASPPVGLAILLPGRLLDPTRAQGEFPRTLALPEAVEHCSLITLWEKLIKIGAKVAAHGRYVTFHLAEVAVPRNLFRRILLLIDRLRARPAPT